MIDTGTKNIIPVVYVDGFYDIDAVYDIADSWIFMDGTVHKIMQSSLPNVSEYSSEVCKHCSGMLDLGEYGSEVCKC